MSGRVLAQRSNVEMITVGTESVAWAPDGLQPCYLDPIGHLLFSVMDGNVNQADLVADVVESLGIAIDVASPHVERVVRHLDDHRLLERLESDAVPGSVDLQADGFLRRSGNG